MRVTFSLLAFSPSLVLNDKIASKPSKSLPIPDELYPVIVGIALGDAHIYRNKTENASLHIEQTYKKE